MYHVRHACAVKTLVSFLAVFSFFQLGLALVLNRDVDPSSTTSISKRGDWPSRDTVVQWITALKVRQGFRNEEQTKLVKDYARFRLEAERAPGKHNRVTQEWVKKWIATEWPALKIWERRNRKEQEALTPKIFQAYKSYKGGNDPLVRSKDNLRKLEEKIEELTKEGASEITLENYAGEELVSKLLPRPYISLWPYEELTMWKPFGLPMSVESLAKPYLIEAPLTRDEVASRFGKAKQDWLDNHGRKIQDTFSKILKEKEDLVINKIIFVRGGPLRAVGSDRVRDNILREALQQLAAVQVLKQTLARERPGQAVEVIAQDPDYSETEKAFLAEMGITVREGYGVTVYYKDLDPQTVFVSLNIDSVSKPEETLADIALSDPSEKGPAMILWTAGNDPKKMTSRVKEFRKNYEASTWESNNGPFTGTELLVRRE